MGALDEPLLLKRHRITADEYQLLGTAGVLGPDARVELIDGEVIDMAPIGTRHWVAVTRLTELFVAAVAGRATVSVQQSLRLGNDSEPEPDLAVFKGTAARYRHALPTAPDTLLLVEVSDTTARYDLEIKRPLYARHGIVEYWVIDLDANLLRTHRSPRDGRYEVVEEIAVPGVTSIAALPGVTIDLTGILD